MKCNNDENDTEITEEEPDKIIDGKYVLIQRGEQERIIEYKANESIKYGRGSNLQEVSLENAFGCLFYSTFRVRLHAEKQKGKDPKLLGQLCYLEPVIVTETVPVTDRNSSGKDNRNIFDDNKSQPLGAVDIATMRELGVSGPEILETLVTKSKTFCQKTEFSQEKYIKKKEKQYGDTLIFLKPTISILVDYYFRKDPSKIMNMRADSLSQMLSYANVHANGKFLVYETGCSGLLVASILHRLGGLGIALHAHTGSTPQRQALFYMNFTKRELQPLRSLDVFYIIRPNLCLDKSETVVSRTAQSQEVCNSESEEPTPKKFKSEDNLHLTELDKCKEITKRTIPTYPNKSSTKDKKSTSEESNLNGSGEDITVGETVSPVARLGNINRLENEKSAAILYATEFDGLLICSKEHPLSILQCLLPRLGPSAPFAIFCQYPEPLVECYAWIKETNIGVNLNISENWMRNIQVETERTHPEINMNSNGGFLLFGLAVKI